MKAIDLVGKTTEVANKQIVMAGLDLTEYGEYPNHLGYNVYRNEDTEQEIVILYQWIKIGEKKYAAGVVKRAEVYEDLICHEKPYTIATIDELIVDAVNYVRDNKTWSAWEDDQALDCINNREPIPHKIADEIYDLMEEWGEEHNLPENWWGEFKTEDDIFLDL